MCHDAKNLSIPSSKFISADQSRGETNEPRGETNETFSSLGLDCSIFLSAAVNLAKMTATSSELMVFGKKIALYVLFVVIYYGLVHVLQRM